MSEDKKGLFLALVEEVMLLPYGRTTDRADFSLVIKEGRGTCSTKHAFLADYALKNGHDQVELILAMYKMDGNNTPGVGLVLEKYDLAYIPEAHCYLRIDDERMDITKSDSDISKLTPFLIEEQVITPEQIGIYKQDYHQSYLKRWVLEENNGYTFEQIWAIREECIEQLSNLA